MELWVYSRPAIEGVRPHEVPHIIISITSGPQDVARFRATDRCKGILRLVFLDALEPSDAHPEELLFSREQAQQVWRFVLDHADVERVLVHCDAGRSRSPAVAAAIASAFNGGGDEYMGGRYTPNMRVHRMLMDTCPRM